MGTWLYLYGFYYNSIPKTLALRATTSSGGDVDIHTSEFMYAYPIKVEIKGWLLTTPKWARGFICMGSIMECVNWYALQMKDRYNVDRLNSKVSNVCVRELESIR